MIMEYISNPITMTYSFFLESVLEHLEKYKREVLKIEDKGTYKYQGKDIPKGHILPLTPPKTKEQIVKEFNQLECIKNQPFLIAGHLHRYAHHLNSSQIMCYNFFRPYIKGTIDKYFPTKDLVKLLHDNGINICLCDGAKCKFEYVNLEPEWEDEGTNFDFFLESGEKKIYFEIKYTEQGFGGCKNDEKHKNKFEGNYMNFKGGYKEKIEECHAIKEGMKHEIKFDEDFRKNYQLFRNVIRVINKKTYSVFIYDERNEIILTQFKNFRDNYISDEYKENVIAITWQELANKDLKSDHREQFCKKYLV